MNDGRKDQHGTKTLASQLPKISAMVSGNKHQTSEILNLSYQLHLSLTSGLFKLSFPFP